MKNKEENIISAYFDSCILPRGGSNLQNSPEYVGTRPTYRSPPKATLLSYLHDREELIKTLKNPEIQKKKQKKQQDSDQSSEQSFLEIVESASGKEDDYFEVEQIRGKEIRNGQPFYLVKWHGYPEDQCTWEPLDHLKHAIQYVKKYERKKMQSLTHSYHERKRANKREKKLKEKRIKTQEPSLPVWPKMAKKTRRDMKELEDLAQELEQGQKIRRNLRKKRPPPKQFIDDEESLYPEKKKRRNVEKQVHKFREDSESVNFIFQRPKRVMQEASLSPPQKARVTKILFKHGKEFKVRCEGGSTMIIDEAELEENYPKQLIAFYRTLSQKN